MSSVGDLEQNIPISSFLSLLIQLPFILIIYL